VDDADNDITAGKAPSMTCLRTVM